MGVLAAALAVCGAANDAWGQAGQIPAPPQPRPIAIVNAVVHTAAAEGPARIERGWVAFREGVIVGVGAMDAPPSLDAGRDEVWEVIDAGGRHVAPGFIAMNSRLGLVEVLQVRATDDRREQGEVTPEVVPAVAVNPDSDLLPVARAAGILHAAVWPLGGTMPGQCSLIRLDGWTNEDLAVEPTAALVVNWPLMEPARGAWVRRSADEQRRSTAAQLRAIEELFDAAAAWQAARAADPQTPADARLHTVAGYLDGRRPILVSCGSTQQIEAAVAMARRRGVRIAIVGGPGALECADLLVEEGIPVVVDGVHRLPRFGDDRPREPFALAGELHRRGVVVAIAAGVEPAHERDLPHHAITAAAHGLPLDEALAAITRRPAEILGVADRLGSIEPGRSATLAIFDGEPLEVTSTVRAAFIDGRGIDLSSRQTRQRDKYLEKLRRLGAIDETR
jgi:imidazolonepropionase-like amidohydrolase